jgi:hypothetical protein
MPQTCKRYPCYDCARDAQASSSIKIPNFVALVRKRTIPTERPPLAGEDSANICRHRGVTSSEQHISTAVNLGFLDPEPLLLHSSSCSVILTRLRGPRSRPTTSQSVKKFGSPGNRIRDLCICCHELWPLDHRGGRAPHMNKFSSRT